MRYILRLALVLGLISAVAAGGLALTNRYTEERIAGHVVRAKQEALREVMPQATRFALEPDQLAALQEAGDASLRDVTELYEAHGADGPVGIVCTTEVTGYGGPIIMLVGIDAGGSITGTKIISASGETPGLGSKIKDDSFQGQFLGQDAGQPLVLVTGQAGGEGEIQSIASATMSCSAVVRAVNAAAATFRGVLGDGGDRLAGLQEDAARRLFPAATEVTADPELVAELHAAAPATAGATDLYRAWRGETLLGYAVAAVAEGYGGPITAVVGFAPGGEIAGVLFVDMPGETVGLGTKITEEQFIGQFTGKPAAELGLTKGAPAGDEIQAVAGATKSCRGAVDAVNNAIRLFGRLPRD